MGFPGDALGGAGFRRDRHDRSARATPPSEPLFSWVPIRSLAPRHRQRILTHLLALDRSDRYLRFGHPATDVQIEKYVASLDFERDEVFGIFNRRLQLIAVAHARVFSRGRRRGAGPANRPLLAGTCAVPSGAPFAWSVWHRWLECARGTHWGESIERMRRKWRASFGAPFRKCFSL